MALINKNVPAGNANPNNPSLSISEISTIGKWFAGFLLILFTIGTIITMIAHWPDRMPSPRAESAKYKYQWFAVSLYSQTDSVRLDSAGNEIEIASRLVPDMKTVVKKPVCFIDLNTLIMLLIALGGFLGNMVHISTSFTNYVGADKFRKRWILWYCVKPFTAAALAVGIYIIFRAGFLNGANATTNINLYGVVSIAILAGLFTDKATDKLRQVFGVIFQTNEAPRPDPIDNGPIKVTDITPAQLNRTGNNDVVLSGSGFDKQKYVVKINGQEITGVTATEHSLSFAFTVPPDITDNEVSLVIFDEKGNAVYNQKLAVAAAILPQPQIDTVDPTVITTGTEAAITITGSGLDTVGIVVKMDAAVITNSTAIATTISFAYTAAADGDINLLVSDKDGNEIHTTVITAAAG
jgi:IPT/TIG domain